MPRPKGSPNKITAEIKERLSQVIMNAMSTLDIDSMTQNEKLKLIQIGLTYVIPRLKQVEEITEEEVAEQAEELEDQVEQALIEADAGVELPENIQKVVDFMNDTGGSLEDYVNCNDEARRIATELL